MNRTRHRILQREELLQLLIAFQDASVTFAYDFYDVSP